MLEYCFGVLPESPSAYQTVRFLRRGGPTEREETR